MNREAIAIAEGDEDESRPPLDRRVRVRGGWVFIGALVLVDGYDEEEEEEGYDAGEADLGGWFHDLEIVACPEVRETEAGYEYDAYAYAGAEEDEEDSLEEEDLCSDLCLDTDPDEIEADRLDDMRGRPGGRCCICGPPPSSEREW